MSKLYFRYGAMNSGKTTILLQVIHNYEEKCMPVLLLKPAKDTKGATKVVSRIGINREVDSLVKPADDINKIINSKDNLKAIVVDEAQFLTPKQVDELYAITKKKDIPVLCYGLRCDFQMQGFPGSTRLLEIADDIEELKTICKCGSKATQNMRLVNGQPTFTGSQVAIDGTDNVTYESVCGKCYLKYKAKYKK
jgi:thymidine kinase